MSSLLKKITNRATIKRAWKAVRKKDSAPGVDNITVRRFEASKKSSFRKIQSELLNGTYSFQPSRQKAISKRSGGSRNIHIFAMRDKVVQQCIQSILLAKRQNESLFPEVYNDIAIAYIPNLNGVSIAVSKVKEYYSTRNIFLTTLDIKNFFDNIPGKMLLQKITSKLPDQSINWLIKKTITQKVFVFSKTKTFDKVLQGSVLAPLYSNIFLADFDSALSAKGIKAIRYADDLALFSKSSEEAIKHKKTVRKLLSKICSMEFYPDANKVKGPKIRCINDYAEFLGIRFSLGTRKYLIVEPTRRKIKMEKQRLTDIFNSPKNLTIISKITKSNQSVRSWCYHYFKSVKCHQRPMRSAITDITSHLSELVAMSLRKIQIINQAKILTTEQLKELGVLGPSQLKRKR